MVFNVPKIMEKFNSLKIKACGRPAEVFNVQKIKRCTYICSKHFVGGHGPTIDHPDPIPALLHTDEQVS